ncbi:MAG TPA: DUF5666 domain-containing protein [Steroidobacteraceae bacterium]|jgi:hypothetical protein|nr:DUF5666 domain-containing protein [Steroidobacteraceae bacterium]
MLKRIRSRWNLRLLAGLAVCCLSACGGDQVAGIQGSGAPVAAGVTSVGTISGFGSVILGGVEYDTSGAQIRIDDLSGAESQLRVGQVITLKGSINNDGTTGKATDIDFASDVRGPIAQVDVDNLTAVVLGQTVRIDDSTVFDDGLQIESLQAGTFVQVSGYANAAGELLASRVDPASPSASLQVKGVVQSLDTVAHTFHINSLTVDYSTATPPATLANGITVLVRGSGFAPSGALIAPIVQAIGPPSFAANDKGQISGVVTTFTSASDFVVGTQRVVTDGSTVIAPNGATVALNARVDVQGTFNASGALLATKIQVKPQSLSVVGGLVDAVSAANNTVTVLGVTATVSSATSFEDKSSQKIRLFKLADVRTGDYVEVRGTPDTNSGGLAATLVERDKPNTSVYVQGQVLALNAPNFTVLGITVATDAQTKFSGPDGKQFFTAALNRTVIVRGTMTGDVLLADKVQLRPH